jgi:hypothetical protein
MSSASAHTARLSIVSAPTARLAAVASRRHRWHHHAFNAEGLAPGRLPTSDRRVVEDVNFAATVLRVSNAAARGTPRRRSLPLAAAGSVGSPAGEQPLGASRAIARDSSPIGGLSRESARRSGVPRRRR